jgi:molybdopterin/thiamine biosynthesis adenylyltransferase
VKDEAMETHHIHPELQKHEVRVLVVGCGGNGSAIAAGLPYLHQALLAYRDPEGLHVNLLDPDVISPTNCVRQPFSQSEIGLDKSVVPANRLNSGTGEAPIPVFRLPLRDA